MPKTLSNIIVSIHAIATFQALHDYLRPRVAGLMAGGSRLSSMLAALASSGLTPGSSAAGLLGELPRPPPSDSASIAGITRRRSQRLSAKKSGQLQDSDAGDDAQAAQSNEPGQSASSGSNALEPTEAGIGEPAPSDTVVNEDEYAEFTDDEVDVDAEVIEEDGDQEMPDKTVTVSVGDGKYFVPLLSE